MSKLIIRLQEYLAPQGILNDTRIAIAASVIAWIITVMLRLGLGR